MRVLDSKNNRIIIKVFLSLLFLSTAILPWVIELGHLGASWINPDPGIFDRVGSFIPLAIMITTILFRSRIARLKRWKKVVLLVTSCVLISYLIWDFLRPRILIF